VGDRETPAAGPALERALGRDQGMILALVLVLALLLSVSMISFTRRAVVDTMIVRNRDDAARAAALARSGVRLGTALLLEDRAAKQLQAFDDPNVRLATQGNTLDDLWNQVRDFELVDPDGGRLQIEIRDAGSLLNLNAVVPYTGEEAPPDPDAEEFLVELLTKVVDEMPIDPGEKLYEPRDLARNLIDWMDADPIRLVGGREDDYYLAQDPPYTASNGPLLSVEEVGLVEGFDVQLVDALRHYVTVYPLVGGNGINLNTAPPHVLALIYYGVSGDKRLVDKNIVARILRMREQGQVICTTSVPDQECITLSEVDLGEGSIFPPVELPDESMAFTIRARGTVGDIERVVTAVVDRSELTDPQLLFWRME
jgi:general secretion pathway protein K